ncbi:spinster family MFS transporter [Sphingomonas abietis]|uniref:MFS transporter n=1 Tax=Sphingomonas abietis TaxID=3012344 RepID=A0ABY7NP37_9SPHN|nr:MFS transporter [Sphingomonas abietis]WBO21689.1 MFS transporter [Sphingomonas abietis]
MTAPPADVVRDGRKRPEPGPSDPAPRDRRYALVVASFLALVYSFNFMDRQIMSVLQESIRREMGLSDTQLGMLTGLSFALFYTGFGIPVAWLSDRYRRVSIMAAACAIWSLATAGCGLARGFTQLTFARVMVGAGEAGGSPPSYSLLSDYFPPSRRATGLAIYSLGVPIGSAFGVALGGWVAAHYGWRSAFVAVGLPGLVLAALMLVIVREPQRGRLDPPRADAAGAAAPVSLPAGLRAFFGNRIMVLTAIASGLSAFAGYALLSWNPSFLARVKGMGLGEIAGWYGLLLGVTGIIGTFGAGQLVDRLGRRDPRWYGWVPAIAFAIGLPAFLGLLWVPDWRWSMGFLTILGLVSTMYLAPALAVVQNAAPPAQRSLAGATLLFLLNLIGLGGGPLYVGWISDLARGHGAAQPLLVAYAALLPVLLLAIAAHLLNAAAMADERAPK